MLKEFLENSYNSSMLNDYMSSNSKAIDKKTIEFLNTLGTGFEDLSQTEIQEIRTNIALKEYLKSEIAKATESANEWKATQDSIMNLNKKNLAGIDYSGDFNKALNNAAYESGRAKRLMETLNEVELSFNKYKTVEESVGEKTM